MVQRTTQAEDRLITDKEVAHLLGASRSWPWKLVQAGKIPHSHKAVCPLYSLASIGCS